MLDERVVMLLEEIGIDTYLSPEDALFHVRSHYPNLQWREAVSLAAWLYWCRS